MNSADGATHFVLIIENGVQLNTEDGVISTSMSEDLATRTRLALGRQGSTKEQDWQGASGTINMAMVTIRMRQMITRYRNNVLAKLPTNIDLVFVDRFPSEGTEARITWTDCKFDPLPQEAARGQDTMMNLSWQCGNPPVEG